MGQLLLFLAYMAVITAVIWQLVRLLRVPASRTLGRIIFVAGVGSLLLAMLVIGITQ